jgi:hypothetical protein
MVLTENSFLKNKRWEDTNHFVKVESHLRKLVFNKINLLRTFKRQVNERAEKMQYVYWILITTFVSSNFS